MFIVSELHIIRYLQSYIHIRMMPWIFMILLRFANPFMTLETIDLFIRTGVHEVDVKIGGNIQKTKNPVGILLEKFWLLSMIYLLIHHHLSIIVIWYQHFQPCFQLPLNGHFPCWLVPSLLKVLKPSNSPQKTTPNINVKYCWQCLYSVLSTNTSDKLDSFPTLGTT